MTCYVTIMSFFNTQIICLSCADAERKLPRFQSAHDAEVAACQRGDFNFNGIGLELKEQK